MVGDDSWRGVRRRRLQGWLQWSSTTYGITTSGDSRGWAASNQLNLYANEDFRSREIVLTFRVGWAILAPSCLPRRRPVHR